MLIVIIVLIIILGSGAGYRYRDYGPHIGCGTILLIALLFFLLNGRL